MPTIRKKKVAEEGRRGGTRKTLFAFVFFYFSISISLVKCTSLFLFSAAIRSGNFFIGELRIRVGFFFFLLDRVIRHQRVLTVYLVPGMACQGVVRARTMV